MSSHTQALALPDDVHKKLNEPAPILLPHGAKRLDRVGGLRNPESVESVLS